MVSFITPTTWFLTPLKALNSPRVCSGPSANTLPCRPASLRRRCRSLHRPSFDNKAAGVCVCLCVYVCVFSLRFRVPRCARTAALSAAVCVPSVLPLSVRGEPTTPSSGCDGRKRRSDGGAPGDSTALPAVGSPPQPHPPLTYTQTHLSYPVHQ